MLNSEAPTLRTIAQVTGFSHVTVSFALRDHPSIPLKTRTRIKTAAKRLGYRPNALVTALMRQVRNNRKVAHQEPLAFLTAHESEKLFQEERVFVSFLAGAKRRAETLGFKLENYWLGPLGKDSRSISNILRARGVRGVIVGPIPVPHAPIEFAWKDFAASAIGFSFEQEQFHRACHHQVNGMELLYRQLTQRGYRRIGLAILASDLIRVRYYYLSGFLTAQYLDSAAVSVPPLIIDGVEELPRLKEWAKRHQPDVVISIAWRVYEWMLGNGFKIPQQIAFAQLNLDSKYPNIAGIDQKDGMIGATAVDLVVDQLFRNDSGIPASAKTTLVDGEWVAGSSAPDVLSPAKRKNLANRSTIPVARPLEGLPNKPGMLLR